MLFNSLQFFIFFFLVYILYCLLHHKWQNRMLLVASYIFYGSWDARFLSLIWISTIIDYLCGLRIYKSEDIKEKKIYLFCSVFANLAILGFFKYSGFFAEGLQHLLHDVGIPFHVHSFNIILPVGISFYTFQTMSYTIDIYYGKIKPTKNVLDFALFVAFFPQLVAGPIERAKNLLPQILRPREITLDKFYAGCFLIMWGLFQKIYVADNLAKLVDTVFAWKEYPNGMLVLVALYSFAFQIFCDFAGYSNIARGVSKCMGFEIMVNFNLPYFATNPRDFWKRWHISLSTWLRDYLYIPLGGDKNGLLKTYRNLCITMLLGGLWHGAAWTFVLWGAYHATLLILHRMLNVLFRGVRFTAGVLAQRAWNAVKVICFFHLICFGWLIFRAQSFGQIIHMAHALFFKWEGVSIVDLARGIGIPMHFLGLLLLVQFLQFVKKDLMIILKFNILARALFYYICFVLIIIYGVTGAKEFIYFQF